MQTLASIFPLLVVVAALALAVFAIRLDRRLSRGSQSAGPRHIVQPEQVGLQRTPWELKALDDQVRAVTNNQARSDLVQTINRLTKAAGIDDPAFVLTTNANDHMIDNVIRHLEHRLELPDLQPVPNHDGLGSRFR